ncbi:S6 family peptidase [Edwardsiella anguillarum]|uniref:S6 family peptidase n=1 Tax=Edwardsiella anguillarum TaxID=1821960 RepID=UPI0024B6EA29|nr:S6 family peptidase [Edwardsiella anguillarum]WHP78990.1 autotransporter outer membrane beta-barrel domain-containing protein [Edwardsiella anguillarum]WHQ16447.1 autotransporter outer membrane beta-barrel domain-containing protein [Edwardsiella anguillarum]WHQ19982.1 autotransporter outer membrane beta-barrel domain-containing protein [Edwardsiella anguillarum]WHQ23503.1 autotransporter outer membrane beta-barrel domain-containing protein [Edwardsiella anguillarum]WHQ27076.1 autotransporte
MNKIFSLKYSNISGGYIAVAEYCRGAKKTGRQKINPGISPLLFFGALLSASPGIASVVSDEIPYSVFRDFAENKGVFQPGAENIEIYNKAGELVGVLDKAPFPDFSSASASSGIAALVAPQYIAGVAHNGGYSSVSFGDSSNNYRLVDRNEYGVQDFHLPRLNKIVTEVVPIPMTTAGIARDTYKNTARFPIFYRVGSGNQYTKTRDGRLRHLQGAYGYLTGGTIGVPGISDHTIVANPGDTFDPINGPLASYGAPGDSGSPLYTYDAQEGRWVLVAVLRSYNGDSGRTNWWVVLPTDFIHAEMAKDSDPAVTFTAGQGALQWTYDSRSNSGSLSQPRSTVQFTMHGQAGNDLNAGKNLLFQTDGSGAGGEILLQNTINQGAGVLTFEDSYRVTPQNNQTWVGGGIIVNPEATLDWQVNGVAGDNLHRLGSGTLYVRGVGINEGGLKVGDGLTLLDQRPDAAGNVRAFSSLNIASGRPTVKLMADGQLDPDTVTWGFRGGVLDLNGHDMAFHTLRMADYGAKVTNSADARAQLSLNYQPLNYLSAVAYPLRGWTDARVGTPGDLYRYENRHTNTVDYFLLNTSGNYGYFPTNQTSNGPWTYLGHDEASARQTLMLNEQRRSQIIHGQFSDNLDIVNLAEPGMIGTTVFDGRVAITGDFSQRGGSLQFQGHPVTHARDFSTGRPPVSADQPDWEARSFALNTLTLTQADFSLARNAVLLGDIQADASRVILNSNRVFVDSRDGEGVTSADTDVSEGQLSAEVVARSEHQGNILLENRSILVAGGLLNGAVTAANSLVALMADSEHTGDIAARDSLLWLVSGAEQLGDLQLSGVAQLTSLGGIVGNLSAAAGAALLEQGSQLQGDVTLTDGATLISRGQTRGNLSADASALTLESGAVQQGDLQLSGGAQLTSQGEIEGRLRADASSALLAQGSLHRGGDIGLSDGATLALAGRNQSAIGAEASLLALGRSAEQRGDIALSQSLLVSGGRSQGALNLSDSGAYFGQASQHRGDLSLLGDDAWLVMLPGAELRGDLTVDGAGLLRFGASPAPEFATVLLERGSQLQGDVTLMNSAALTSRGLTRGSLSADASAITLESGAVQQGDLQLSGGARLTSLGEIEGRLRAEGSTVLLEQGSQLQGDVTLTDSAALTSRGETRGSLISHTGTITLENGAVQQGDLQLSGGARLTSLGEIEGRLRAEGSTVLLEQGSQLQGDVTLTDGAALTSRGETRGSLSTDASAITLESGAVQQGDLQLSGGARLTSLGEIEGRLRAEGSTVLLEQGSQLQGDVTLTDSAALTSRGETRGSLISHTGTITLENGAVQQGDLQLSGGAQLTSLGEIEGRLSAEGSTALLEQGGQLQGDVTLTDGAALTSRGETRGNLSADASTITLESDALQQGEVRLDRGTTLTSQGGIVGNLHADASTITLESGAVQQGDLQLGGASDLTSLGEIVGSLSVDASSVLLERGSQLQGDVILMDSAALTSRGQTRGILSVAASAITLENGAEQQGDIRLDNGASLTSQGLTEGLLSADASTITLESGAVQQGDLQLGGASDLTSLGEIEGSLSVDASSVLLEQGSQLLGDITLAGNAALTSRGQTRGLLSADASAITLENGAVQQGDLQLSDASDLTSLGEIEGRLSVDASSVLLERGSQLQGDVTLTDGAALTSRGQTRGLLSADASAIALESGALQQGEVRLDKGTTLTSQGGIVGNLSMDASNALLEWGSQLQGDVTLAGNAALTSRGQTRGLLSADASIIALESGAVQRGDLQLSGGAQLTSQGEIEGRLRAEGSTVLLEQGSQLQGDVTLAGNAALTSRGQTRGLLSADASIITLESGAVQRGDLQLSGGAQLTSQGEIEGRLRAEGSSALLAQGSLHRGGDIGLSDGATLALAGRNQSAIGAEASLLALGRSAEQRGDVALSQSLLVSGGRSQGTLSLSDSGAYFGQASQHRGDLSLQGDDAWLAVLSGAALRGDLTVDGAGLLRFGTSPAPEIAIAATPPAAGPADYRGRIAAPEARVEMRDTLWRMSGTSTLGSLRVEESLITATDGAFMTLSVDRLHADGAALVLRADAGISDRLVINERLSGGNNTVLVNYLEPTLPEGQLDVSLISAPVGSDRETFTAHRQHMGFSEVMPALITREADSQLEWVLSGFDVTPDSEREEDAASLLSLNYRSFMAEVQYLDKRQLDLRNGPAGTGAWARVLHGAGSAAENYRDRYLHLQLGADRRYGLGDESDLLAGVTFTFTDGRASGDAFSSRSRALGAGLYATALFPSGLFVDLNGKYVHHSTEYQVNLAGLGERKASNHAWYARADVGYRYELGESAFVEPHLELVYGTYSSTRFDWQDQGMAVSLAQPRFTPLLATAGVALGKRVDIGEWQTTLRAGLDYQSALRPAGDTRLRDASGERTIRGERDGRLRYSLGAESRIGDALQLGLEVERSSLGDYNLDYSVQATLRYRF